MKKNLTTIIGVAIVGVVAYVYRDSLYSLFVRVESMFLPCQKPITYKIESFDTKFGISRDYFLSALRDAEAVWEKPSGRELFVYEPEGVLNINLIYDYRQETTATLQKLGLAVDDDKASYDSLQATYDDLQTAYSRDKAEFEARVAAFKERQREYEKEVAYWNSRHGAPPHEYEKLNAQKAALNAEIDELKRLQAGLNEQVDSINTLVVTLNRLATTLNLQVAQYNTIGESRGSEFEEGNYQSGLDGQQIDIYEFENRDKLVRVLAHEFGHALGLGHVEDTKAIMYRLNNGINGKPTATDIEALTKLCGI